MSIYNSDYNYIYVSLPSYLSTGTAGNDSIYVYGNHTTVNAIGGDDIVIVEGGNHSNGTWVEGAETNLIYAGEGKDEVYVQSRGASVYGEAGDDYIFVNNAYTYANGGEGNDIFYFEPGCRLRNLTNNTVTSGAGNDTVEIKPENNYIAEIVVTDFSNDDALRIDSYEKYNDTVTGSHENRAITQQVVNGNVIIRDNSSISSSDDGTVTTIEVDPTFSVTLQGVSDIRQVADAKYYRYAWTSFEDYRTFGELFGVSSTPTVQPDSPTVKPDNPTPTPTIQSDANAYVYSGGNVTVSATESYYSSVKGGYTTYDQVNFTTDLISFGINDDKISINSSAGTLTLKDMRGKYMNYADGSGTPFAYSYIGVNGSNINTSVSNGYSTVNNSYNRIDNSDRTVYGVVIGGDNLNDSIIAGSGGSSLWGGSGGNDTLVGGAGADEFVYKLGSGNDVIQGATSSDFVNLEGIKLSQITSIDTSGGAVTAKFSDGGSIKIEGTESVGIKVDGWTVAYNHSSGSWQVK